MRKRVTSVSINAYSPKDNVLSKNKTYDKTVHSPSEEIVALVLLDDERIERMTSPSRYVIEITGMDNYSLILSPSDT